MAETESFGWNAVDAVAQQHCLEKFRLDEGTVWDEILSQQTRNVGNANCDAIPQQHARTSGSAIAGSSNSSLDG